MEGMSSGTAVGNVLVSIVNGGTKTPDMWAREVTDKIMQIGDNAPQPIRDQALAFKEQIYRVIRDNFALAIEHEREWLHKQARS